MGDKSSLATRKITDPILRNALRYTVSPREYQLLHQYLIARPRPSLRRRGPGPSAHAEPGDNRNADDANREAETDWRKPAAPAGAGASDNTFHVAAVRAAIRLFVAAYTGLRVWDRVSCRLKGVKPSTRGRVPRARLSLALALILLFHRLIHRVLTRLRNRLVQPSTASDGSNGSSSASSNTTSTSTAGSDSTTSEKRAQSFRVRNSRLSAVLSWHGTPAVGASLAGSFLAIAPVDKDVFGIRTSLAIYLLTQSLDAAHEALDRAGLLFGPEGLMARRRPWWLRSWLLVPVAFAQLFYSFVLERRTCFPAAYEGFILNRSPAYFHPPPKDYPPFIMPLSSSSPSPSPLEAVAAASVATPFMKYPWPTPNQVVESLAEVSSLNWPPYISPILFPDRTSTLPLSQKLQPISPLTIRGHPALKALSCAILHPNDSLCVRTYLRYWLLAFPRMFRLFFLLYAATTLLSRVARQYIIQSSKATSSVIAQSMLKLLQQSLRTSIFLTGSIGTAWASVCVLQRYLPRTRLPTARWALAGAVAGLWAFVDRHAGRARFLQSARLALASFAALGVKRRWWPRVPGVDVACTVLALAFLGLVIDLDPSVLRHGGPFGLLMLKLAARGSTSSSRA